MYVCNGCNGSSAKACSANGQKSILLEALVTGDSHPVRGWPPAAPPAEPRVPSAGGHPAGCPRGGLESHLAATTDPSEAAMVGRGAWAGAGGRVVGSSPTPPSAWVAPGPRSLQNQGRPCEYHKR